MTTEERYNQLDSRLAALEKLIRSEAGKPRNKKSKAQKSAKPKTTTQARYTLTRIQLSTDN